MLKVDQEWIARAEAQYPGLRKTIYSWDAMDLPPCPLCGSANTAKVSAGLVGRSLHLAAATTKIRLLANGYPADCYCNQCGRYFDGPDSGNAQTIGARTK